MATAFKEGSIDTFMYSGVKRKGRTMGAKTYEPEKQYSQALPSSKMFKWACFCGLDPCPQKFLVQCLMSKTQTKPLSIVITKDVSF